MFFINLVISASVSSFSVWLAERSPNLAGFIVSLPISTLVVLALNQIQHGNAGSFRFGPVTSQVLSYFLALISLTNIYFLRYRKLNYL